MTANKSNPIQMKMTHFLNLPFEHFITKKEKWTYVLTSSLFFILFLSIYQPFGIYTEAENENFTLPEFFMILLSIGTIVFLVLCVSQFLLRKRFAPAEFNIRFFLKWFFMDILFIVTIMNVVEFFVLEDDVITLSNVMEEVIFGVIGSFLILFFTLLYPVIGSLAFVHLKQLHIAKKELEKDLNEVRVHYKIASGSDAPIKMLDENGACKLTVAMNHIFMIESRNQYVSIKYKKNDRVIEQNIRARFSHIFNDLKEFPTIMRCHRSFAVNLMNVEDLQYIDQKPYLILCAPSSEKIPVSKTYLKEVKSKLSEF